MGTAKIPLSVVKVASPCTASWYAMSGDDKARFCGQCAQYVYNLSEMTKEEAEALIMEHEGKMCVRIYKRADGTMMTKDCPVGWRAIKRRTAIAGTAIASVVVAVFGLLTLGVFGAGDNGRVRFVNPIELVRDLLFPPPVMMGEMCPPPPVPAAPEEEMEK